MGAQNFEKPGNTKQGKLNMDVKKNTFIDQIINFNTKKMYPLPSPCSYYLDEKLAKKFYPDNTDIMLVKSQEATKKTNLPKAERKFILVKRGSDKLPGPDKYTPVEPFTDIQRKIHNKQEFLAYKKYKDHVAEVTKRHKETKERDDARHQEIVGKLRDGTLVKNPRPLPVDLMTFDKISIIYKDVQVGKASKKKGNGFGTEDRFLADELSKWKRKMEAYNKGVTDGKPIDLKKDPQPGPAQYSLIAAWPGKKIKNKKKKDDDGDKKLPNIFKTMSKGPSINYYYQSMG